MSKEKLKSVLVNEINRIDDIKTAKRNEIVIEGFQKNDGIAPKAIIDGKLAKKKRWKLYQIVSWDGKGEKA